jgi:hypothetical protein
MGSHLACEAWAVGHRCRSDEANSGALQTVRIGTGGDAVGELNKCAFNILDRHPTVEVITDLVSRLGEIVYARNGRDTLCGKGCRKLIDTGVGTGCRSHRHSGTESDTAPD